MRYGWCVTWVRSGAWGTRHCGHCPGREKWWASAVRWRRRSRGHYSSWLGINWSIMRNLLVGSAPYDKQNIKGYIIPGPRLAPPLVALTTVHLDKTTNQPVLRYVLETWIGIKSRLFWYVKHWSSLCFHYCNNSSEHTTTTFLQVSAHTMHQNTILS